LREGKQPTIYGDGRQTRDFIDVSNVVAANIALMTSDKHMAGDVFNVGTGISISILDLWKFLARVAECDLKPHFGAARDGDIRHSCADVSKIKEALGWSLKTGTQEGLISLYEMMRDSES
jgi:UDP-glucose 4-epimerase